MGLFKKVKGIGIFFAGLAGVFAALFLMGRGTRRVEQADAKMKKAEDLRERAYRIDLHIETLKKEARLTNEQIAAERKRIEQIDDLEALRDEFTKMGY